VRFGELKGLTSLPIPRLAEQFRNEEVLTVLPVRDAAVSSESVLVATHAMLAILTALDVPPGEWMTRWATWDTVLVHDPGTPSGDDGVYRLAIRIGNQTFEAKLAGEPGRRALRDFVVALRMSHPMRSAGH
jgi:hypothetical protein